MRIDSSVIYKALAASPDVKVCGDLDRDNLVDTIAGRINDRLANIDKATALGNKDLSVYGKIDYVYDKWTDEGNPNLVKHLESLGFSGQGVNIIRTAMNDPVNKRMKELDEIRKKPKAPRNKKRKAKK